MTDICVIIPVDSERQPSTLFFTQWYEQTVDMNRFEILIITSNEEQSKFIQHLYQKTLNLKPKELEVNIIYKDVKQNRAKAMNLGIEFSKAPLLYLFGEDFTPTKKAIEQHLSFHQNNPSLVEVGIGLAFIPNEFKNDFSNWLEISGSLFGIPFKKDQIAIPSNFFYLANTSIKKEFVLQAGLFDENFKYNCWDDWELGLRLSKKGMKSRLVMGSNAIHNHDVQISERFKSMQQAGESCKIYENKFPCEPRTWAAITKRSPRIQFIKVQLYLLLSKIIPSAKIKHLYFKEKMDLGFLLGYQNISK
jgi:GT2 family glycosyltransferase